MTYNLVLWLVLLVLSSLGSLAIAVFAWPRHIILEIRDDALDAIWLNGQEMDAALADANAQVRKRLREARR